MKQSAKSALFSLLFLVTTIFIGTLSAAPSGEAANPFNQFSDPSGGVSAFTGSSSYAHPLLSLSSKGAVGLPITLAYSGNVELNARATNEIAPTSWVGLGWSFGFGSIIANHNNTQTLMDDSYTWISPEGVAYPIYLYRTGALTSDTMCATATSTLLSAPLQAVFFGQPRNGKKAIVRKKMDIDKDKQYR